MKLTRRSSTGHFAMFQTVTAVSPTPITSPSSFAIPPVMTTPAALMATSTSSATVRPTRSGSVL